MIHQAAYEAGIQNIRLHRPPPYYGQHIDASFVYLPWPRAWRALLVQTCRDDAADCVYAITAKLDGDLAMGQLFTSRLVVHEAILKDDRPR